MNHELADDVPFVETRLREGFTTGACAAAAAKAAVTALLDPATSFSSIEIPFPDGRRHLFAVEWLKTEENAAEAAIRKEAGDDPDITQGVLVIARVSLQDGHELRFEAGPGVGRVTKPGLSIPPGEPAINPGPRAMIRAAVAEVTERGVLVNISIPGGDVLAQKTFNPRLGILGGLSVLGTTGRVRPFSCQAIQCSVLCELDVARAAGLTELVLVPGHIGERSAHRYLRLKEDQLIEVGNEWGFVLERLPGYPFKHLLLWGHPGKLAKLAGETWDTHSYRSPSALEVVRQLGLMPPQVADAVTMEGLFEALPPSERRGLSQALSAAIAQAALKKAKHCCSITVCLVNMAGELLGDNIGFERFQ